MQLENRNIKFWLADNLRDTASFAVLMFFFTPRYIKEAKHYLHGAKKFLNYKRDILKQEEVTKIEENIKNLCLGMRERNQKATARAVEDIEKTIGKIAPPSKDAIWQENVEVLLVAIVIATGVRAYFLEPFKIPTGSMQPTLFGVVGTPMDVSPPNPLTRAFEFGWLGRSYFNVTAKEDDTVTALQEKTYANFFTFTDIICDNHTYTVFAPQATLTRDFHVQEGQTYRANQPIVRGYVDTGDQVLVDKLSYNFTKPKHGNVFVFTTTGIYGIERTLPPGVESEHYIKRLAGLPGDTLRVNPPQLYINGQLPTQFGFQQVMSCRDGYRGYSNGYLYLNNPEDTFTVPFESYFAMGDNSYNSFDSRYWGIVPQQNVTGKGLFVYWPFSKRWGLIR